MPNSYILKRKKLRYNGKKRRAVPNGVYKKALELADEELRDFMIVLAETGARRSEIANLKDTVNFLKG